jgi:NADPH:quinone reductase-like Zn-dependent oxidoreductase
MRAVVIRQHGGPEVLKIEEVDDPVAGPGQVLVRVRACALNHLDLWIRRGVSGAAFHLPAITGADIAGDVAALGEGAAPLPIGTPVMIIPGVSCGFCSRCVSGADHLCASYGILGEGGGQGGLAELVAVPRANVVPMPGVFTYAQGAAASLAFQTAWHMLVARAELRGGETVLVQAGGSGVGTAAIQIARHLGASRILTTVGTAAKRGAALALGATDVIDYRAQDFVEEVRKLTSKRGVDVVFEHVGGPTFEGSLRCLARAGRLVTCGATSGIEAAVNLRHLFFKSQSILGSTMGSKAEYHELVRLFGAGVLAPVIDRVVAMADIAEAHRALEARECFGKVVIAP